MIRSMKVQLKPNNKQNSLLFQCAGTSRFAYNWAIARQEENYKEGGKFLNDGVLRKELTVLKRGDLAWMFKYSNNITKQAVKDACDAYVKFFKGLAQKPKFKTKRKSSPKFYHDTGKIKFTQTHVQLEKIGKVRLVEVGRIPISGKYSNPRISYDGLKWWISVCVEDIFIETDITEFASEKAERHIKNRIKRQERKKERQSNKTTESIGIDVGIKDLAVVSTGEKYENINKTSAVRKTSKRLMRLQRKVSRQYEKIKKKIIKGKGKNVIKLEKTINKTYHRLTNIRTNYIQQITTNLVKTKPEYIVIEDLNVKGMMKNKHLSRAIAEQKLHEFKRQLEYKCLWLGVPLIVADRFYPSSKLCSCCGQIKKDLNLSDRIYKCECGNVIDRDLQAAINLREYLKKLAKAI